MLLLWTFRWLCETKVVYEAKDHKFPDGPAAKTEEAMNLSAIGLNPNQGGLPKNVSIIKRPLKIENLS